jgi:hypothetical protein
VLLPLDFGSVNYEFRGEGEGLLAGCYYFVVYGHSYTHLIGLWTLLDGGGILI